MLISEKTTGSIFFFASKEAYLIIRQLEKITVKKAEAKVVKCAKNKSWVPRNPPWSLNPRLPKGGGYHPPNRLFPVAPKLKTKRPWASR